MVTKPKPRGRPVSRSLTRWTSETAPNSSNAARTVSVDVLKERLPTYRRVLISISLSSGLRHMTPRSRGRPRWRFAVRAATTACRTVALRVREAQRPETRDESTDQTVAIPLLPWPGNARKKDHRRALTIPRRRRVTPDDHQRSRTVGAPAICRSRPREAPSGRPRRGSPGRARAGSTRRSGPISRPASGSATCPGPGAACRRRP